MSGVGVLRLDPLISLLSFTHGMAECRGNGNNSERQSERGSAFIYVLSLKTPKTQHNRLDTHSDEEDASEQLMTSYKHHLHSAYYSRQCANSAARRLLRRYGRVDEEWMDGEGLVRGQTMEAEGGENGTGVVKVKVVRVYVEDEEDEECEDERRSL